MLPAPGPPPQANPQASNLCPALKPRRLIAASDKNAPEAAGCRAALAEAGTALVSPLVLTEADHLAKAQFGSDARSALIDFIIFQARRGQFHIPEITIELLETARQVQRKHAGLDLDLADGVQPSRWPPSTAPVPCSPWDRRDFRAIRPLTPHRLSGCFPDDMRPAVADWRYGYLMGKDSRPDAGFRAATGCVRRSAANLPAPGSIPARRSP